MALPNQQTLLLYLVVLLLLWLFTRKQQERASVPQRRKPMTEEELGRVLFEVARSADLEAFRHLYLSGPEAREALGIGAGPYLDSRGKKWLEEEFLEISVRVAAPARYEGVRSEADGATFLKAHSAAAGHYEVPVGKVVRVGHILRLAHPVGDWAPYRFAGAPLAKVPAGNAPAG